MKNPLDLIHKIVKKTVGYELVGTKPMNDEENKKFWEENERRRKEWEDSHPEEVAKMKAWEEKYKTRKPYTPTNDYLNMMDIYIFNDGDICVRTPQVSWTSLCGREWTINLEKKKVSLTSMN